MRRCFIDVLFLLLVQCWKNFIQDRRSTANQSGERLTTTKSNSATHVELGRVRAVSLHIIKRHAGQKAKIPILINPCRDWQMHANLPLGFRQACGVPLFGLIFIFPCLAFCPNFGDELPGPRSSFPKKTGQIAKGIH